MSGANTAMRDDDRGEGQPDPSRPGPQRSARRRRATGSASGSARAGDRRPAAVRRAPPFRRRHRGPARCDSTVTPHPRVEHGVQQVGDQVDEDERDADDQGEALHDGVVARRDRVVQRLADAGQREDRLGEDRPAEQGAERQPDDGDDREQGAAQGVAADDRELAEALGPGGADVVLTEHVEQARAGHPGDDRQRDRADGDRRQDQVLAGVDDELPVPLQQPVEHLEVGDELEHAVLAEAPLLVERRGDEPRREPARRRQGEERVLERDGEEVLQEQTEHEDRHRDAGVGDDHRADVGRRVALVGGDARRAGRRR